jgi:hypothetical protein
MFGVESSGHDWTARQLAPALEGLAHEFLFVLWSLP